MARKYTLRLLSALAISGCLVTSLASIGLTQGLPGFTIFSGVERENQLSWRMDFDGEPGVRDRYRLRIPAKKWSLLLNNSLLRIPTPIAANLIQTRWK